jgi:hypothetical protein
MDITPPIHLLVAAAGHSGPSLRLPPRPKFQRPQLSPSRGYRPPVAGVDFQLGKDKPIGRQLAEQFGKVIEFPEVKIIGEGNLLFADYRFWVGQPAQASKYAICRCCGQMALGPYARKKHMEASKCTDILVRAYKILIQESLCVVCDVHSTYCLWGVPLHKQCKTAFMFDPACSRRQSSLLAETVALVLAQDNRAKRPPRMTL